jgi:hypothetical protein
MTSDPGAVGAPNFDVVLRGYDRKQVDEHVARLQRVMSRMRADLDMARSHPIPIVSQPGTGHPGGPPRPTPRPRPGHPPQQGGGSPDVVGNFTDRMQSILQAAEEEAAEIRNKARAEEQRVRAQVADLVRQRDALLAELTRIRGQLASTPVPPTGRIDLPHGDSAPSRPGASSPSQGQGAAKQGPGSPQPSSQPPSGARPPASPTPRPRPSADSGRPGAPAPEPSKSAPDAAGRPA